MFSYSSEKIVLLPSGKSAIILLHRLLSYTIQFHQSEKAATSAFPPLKWPVLCRVGR